MTDAKLIDQLMTAFNDAGLRPPRTLATAAASVVERFHGEPMELVVAGDGIEDGVTRHQLLRAIVNAGPVEPETMQYRGMQLTINLGDDDDLVILVRDEELVVPGPGGMFGVLSALTAVNVLDQLVDILRERDERERIERSDRPW